MEQIKGYNTKQKNIIMDMLKEHKNEHLTADDMLNLLNSKGSAVSKATLYRFLDVLVSTGNVRKFIIDEGERSCYQFIDEEEECKEHYHLKCIECGKLFHTECDYLDEIVEHVEKHHNFKVDTGKIVLYGICKDCQDK